MGRPLDIGIVGCGTAGPAAAIFLARQGHAVTVYERVREPRAIGAGIILQPTGQLVLERLGLLDEVVARGARLSGLRVDTEEAGRQLLELQYADVSTDFFGLGLHRGVLFETLFAALKREPNITLRLGVTGDRLLYEGGKYLLIDKEEKVWGPHDLIVAADGARSKLRDDTGLARSCEAYPWGALWFVARDPDRRFEGMLYQIVQGTNRMVGLLPTGLGPGPSEVPLVSLYYSMAARDVDAWRKSGFADWLEALRALVPRAHDLFDQIRGPDDLLFSVYYDVVMSSWNTRAVVHLGDAGHAMSPQLGQGANLALWDAMVLADCIEQTGGPLASALYEYSRLRRSHLQYYQWVTRALTPFFQSDYSALGWLRDLFMPIACRFRTFRRAMVMGMCGTADGSPWRALPLERALLLK